MEQDLLPILDIMLREILVLMPLEKVMIISHKALEQEIMLVSIHSAVKQWLVSFNRQVEMEAQWKIIEDNASMEIRQKLIMLCQAVKSRSQRLKLLKSMDQKLMSLKQLHNRM